MSVTRELLNGPISASEWFPSFCKFNQVDIWDKLGRTELRKPPSCSWEYPISLGNFLCNWGLGSDTLLQVQGTGRNIFWLWHWLQRNWILGFQRQHCNGVQCSMPVTQLVFNQELWLRQFHVLKLLWEVRNLIWFFPISWLPRVTQSLKLVCAQLMTADGPTLSSLVSTFSPEKRWWESRVVVDHILLHREGSHLASFQKQYKKAGRLLAGRGPSAQRHEGQ